MTWLLSTSTKAYRSAKNLRRPYRLSREMAYWAARRDGILAAGRRRARSQPAGLPLSDRQIRAAAALARRDGAAVIATIDQDGYWHSHVGPIDGVPTLDQGGFLRRNKFDIDVVQSADYCGVRKRYRGNRLAFLNELRALVRLGDIGLRVPAILDLDFEQPSLVMSYLPGRVLREELVRAGAPIRNRDRIPGRTREQSWQDALRAGRAVLGRAVTAAFLRQLARDLDRIHQAGVMIRDIKWGNIVIGHDGLPWWLDFHMAEDHSELSPRRFQVLADLDIEQFNRVFGTALPTPTRTPRRPQALDMRWNTE